MIDIMRLKTLCRYSYEKGIRCHSWRLFSSNALNRQENRPNHDWNIGGMVNVRSSIARRGTKFEHYTIQPHVLERARAVIPNLQDPTDSQISLMKELDNRYSVIQTSPQGTGKSTAITLFTLSEPKRNRAIPSVTSLIVVPSKQVAKMYFELHRRILGFDRGDPKLHSIVQALYRGPEAQRQIELLRQYRNPSIVIATPGILLELLADESTRASVNFEFLELIVVDEADLQLKLRSLPHPPHSKSGQRSLNSLKPPRNPKLSRSQISALNRYHVTKVLAYLTKLQKRSRHVYSIDSEPCRTVVISSNVALGGRLDSVVSALGWFADNLTVKRRLAAQSDQFTAAGADTKIISVSTTGFLDRWKANLDSYSPSQVASKITEYDKSKENTISPEIIDQLALYESPADDKSTGLIIIGDMVSKPSLIAELESRGFKIALIDNFDGFTLSDSVYGTISATAMFSKVSTGRRPNFLIASAQTVQGMCFPGLKRIYVLGQAAANAFTGTKPLADLCRTISEGNDWDSRALIQIVV
ncbi:uncharacterized protein V1516DRAFT_709888 [Lipomyces oligophaga]|uniref:uncharacterized protein n=1 Tax=Lipomyces oligophaga TaxID=45792 RepID=UPI0034CD231D